MGLDSCLLKMLASGRLDFARKNGKKCGCWCWEQLSWQLPGRVGRQSSVQPLGDATPLTLRPLLTPSLHGLPSRSVFSPLSPLRVLFSPGFRRGQRLMLKGRRLRNSGRFTLSSRASLKNALNQ